MDELEPGVEYTLTVDGVEDLAGNVQLWPTVLTFKAAVADDVAPMVPRARIRAPGNHEVSLS